MQTLRACVLLLAFVFLTLFAIVWLGPAVRFKLKRRKTFPQRYHSLLCRIFGIRITQIGKPVAGRGVILVPNHVSYLDISIIGSTTRLSYIGRHDLANWPFVNAMVHLQETVLVDRKSRSKTGEQRNVVRERLHAGDTLAIFAEGTSSDGNTVLPFKSSLLAAARGDLQGADDDKTVFPIQPVSIAYVGLHGMPMGREDRPKFAWYGDMELVPHVWEMLKAGPIDVVVEFHPPIPQTVTGRKEIAVLAEAAVRRGVMRAQREYVPPVRPKLSANKGLPDAAA